MALGTAGYVSGATYVHLAPQQVVMLPIKCMVSL